MRSRFNKRTNGNKLNINYFFIVKFVATIILLLILIFGIITELRNFSNIKQSEDDLIALAENNKDIVFEVEEVTLYSSASAKQSGNMKLNIFGFTDISFYVSNPKNLIIKSVKLSNFNFEPAPILRYTNTSDIKVL